MRTLTKEAERKLIGAIEAAASRVNEGMAPNDAIIKSAAEANVPSGHINLMVHAYNTGRTTKQRENGESTIEKAAEFAMADADTVLKALYPEQVKTSAELVKEATVSPEYAISAAGMLARRKDSMRKVAAAQVALPVAGYERPPRDEHAAVMRAQSEKMAAQRGEEEKRRVATVAYSKAAGAMDDLNIYFRTPGNMSFGDALREVNLRLGPTGVSVLQKVAAVYPHFTKQADTQKQHFGDNPVYGLVQTVLGAVDAYNNAQEQVSVKKSEAVSQKTAPQFLTGSILAERVEEPLTLKEAKRFEFGERKGGPTGRTPDELTGKIDKSKVEDTSFGMRDVDGQPRPIEFGPHTPPPPAPIELNPESESAIAELDKSRWLDADENFHRQLETNIGFQGDELNAAELNNELKRKIVQNRILTEEQAFRDQELAAKREQQEQKEKEDTDWARHQEEERYRKDEFDEVEKIRAAKKQHSDTQKKERQETWDQGKTVGEGLGKAFKGDFLGNATRPVKAIAEAMGAKNIGEMTGLAPKDTSKMVREQYQQLVDPSHENALKTIRAKGVLHDMILNDPVVSGYDPQDVAMAFNEIAELAPSLIDTPGVIRPLLRKRLEAGQLADFDVKQILEMDKLRGDRDKTLLDLKEKNLNLL